MEHWRELAVIEWSNIIPPKLKKKNLLRWKVLVDNRNLVIFGCICLKEVPDDLKNYVKGGDYCVVLNDLMIASSRSYIRVKTGPKHIYTWFLPGARNEDHELPLARKRKSSNLKRSKLFSWLQKTQVSFACTTEWVLSTIYSDHSEP